jgi:hypothetical protein
MAVSYNIETLANTERKLVVKFVFVNDSGTDNLPLTDFIDPADYTSQDGKAGSYVSIDRMSVATDPGMQVELVWESAGTDYLAWMFSADVTNNTIGATSVDFASGSWGGLRPPGFGGNSVTANSGTGAGDGAATGTLQIKTIGVSAGDRFTLVVEGTKHYG